MAKRSELGSWILSPRRAADQMMVDVAVEEPGGETLPSREGMVLHQVLRIIDSQYIDHRRIRSTELIRAGLETLETYLGVDTIETATKGALVAHRKPNGESTIALCSDSQNGGRIFRFCPSERQSPSGQKQIGLAAKALSQAVPDHQNFLTRIGSRVFSLRINNKPIVTNETAISSLLNAAAATAHRERREIIHLFVNGLLTELDPHSSFLNEREYRELQSGTMGRFSGIGIVVDTTRQFPMVNEVIPGSSASKAGVLPEDVIIKIEDSVTAFDDVSQIIGKLRGSDRGKAITTWFYRPSTRTVYKAELAREEVDNKSVDMRIIPGHDPILFLRLSSFSEQSSEELWNAYNTARTSRPSLKGMVLDLRGNPGGLLDEAVEVASLFLRHGRVVSVQSRHEQQEEQASQTSPKIDLPLVLLVDSGSASASEILAGALKDHQRALVVGERSYGKGSVQSVFETGIGTALKLTIAHHFTPSGESIQGRGISPHVWMKTLLERDSTIFSAGPSESEREFDLPFHLDNPENPDGSPLQTTLSHAPDPALELWAWQPSNSNPEVRKLINFDLTLPQTAKQSGAVKLQEDPWARAAVGLLEVMNGAGDFARREPSRLDDLALVNAVDLLQQQEKRYFPQQELLASSTEESTDLGARLGVAELLRDSDSSGTLAFTLQSKRGNRRSVPHQGYVILAQKGREEGPNPVIPVTLTQNGSTRAPAYRFRVPTAFSAKIAQDSQTKESELAAYFVTNLQDKPLPLGTFRWKSRKTAKSPVKVTVEENLASCPGSNHEKRCFVLKLQGGLEDCATTGCIAQIVDMLPRWAGIENSTPRLRRTGDSSFEVPLTVWTNRSGTSGSRLSGLIGIILRTPQGELLHKSAAISLNGNNLTAQSSVSEGLISLRAK